MRENMAAALGELRGVEGVRGVMLADLHVGVPVVVAGELSSAATPVAALATALYGRLARATGVAEFGAVQSLEVEGEAGSLLLGRVGDLLLVVATEPDAPRTALEMEIQRILEVLR